MQDSVEEKQRRRQALEELMLLEDELELYVKPAFPDLALRLARSTCRGVRQLEFVNELLTGQPISVIPFVVPAYPYAHSKKYGATRLEHSSWKSLKLRLLQNGFFFSDVTEESFTMKFSG